MAPMPITDAIFLLGERREQPMHVGGLQLFQLPPDSGPDWLGDFYEQMIRPGPDELAPLFRRRPYRPPTGLGAWSWQLDDEIDLEHHVSHSALPGPGRVRELLAFASRQHGHLLDRQRPLWEAHVVEGLEGNRFALYTKIHHALMDGVSALRLLAQSLSTDAGARDMPMPWCKQVSSGSSAPRSAGGIHGLLGIPVAAWRVTSDLAGLGPIAGRAALRALIDSNSHLRSPAPKTVINAPITGARRFAAQGWPMARLRAVADASGTTLNDVVLAMCSAALRSYLGSLGALPDRSLVAMTPVSLRQAGSEVGGNAVGALLCDLATNIDDPADRLAAIHASMEGGKAGLREMTPAQVTLTSAIAMAPMVLGMLPGVRRLANPPFNLVISNIPGPRQPLFWNGARLEGIYPMSIPTDGQALNITVTSYDGSMEFGLTGCRRTVPHLQRMLLYLDEALDELETAVKD